MKLDDVNLLSFIPQFMQQDETTKAFVYAICSKLQIVIDDIKNASIYSRIDELSENVLDMIAEQFNISEYNLSYDISIKRSLIKNCMLIHHQRGTVGAVEKIVNDVFGDGRVEEWFNYDGSPYYFKVYTSNASSSDEMLKEFERIISATQNCRSYLEAAIVELYQSMDIYTCGILTTSTVEKIKCD